MIPSIENEVHRELKEVADETAIKVFAENVRKLLLASPFGSKAVLGVDPGVRTGCKLAVIDDSGKFLAHNVMYLQSKNDQETAKRMIGAVLQNASIRAIAVGNGTAGRETESFVRDALKDMGLNVPVVMVNESGASVYSASAAARLSPAGTRRSHSPMRRHSSAGTLRPVRMMSSARLVMKG